MQYVGGDAKHSECVFCEHLASDNDVESLILLRDEHAFVIMNLYPYNTGHVMIVPNSHVSTPEILDGAALLQMASMRNTLLQAVRTALSPAGFNIGINLGEAAGAGIASHLHEHIVPRWLGDANFMPIVGGTKVLPELLPATYAKIRAELERDTKNPVVMAVFVSADGSRVVVNDDTSLPRVSVPEGSPVWRAASHDAVARGLREFSIIGWGGASDDPNRVPIIIHRVSTVSESGTLIRGKWLPIEEARSGRDGFVFQMGQTQEAFFSADPSPN